MSKLPAFGVFFAIAALGYVCLVTAVLFGNALRGLGEEEEDSPGTARPPWFGLAALLLAVFGTVGAIAAHYGHR